MKGLVLHVSIWIKQWDVGWANSVFATVCIISLCWFVFKLFMWCTPHAPKIHGEGVGHESQTVPSPRWSNWRILPPHFVEACKVTRFAIQCHVCTKDHKMFLKQIRPKNIHYMLWFPLYQGFPFCKPCQHLAFGFLDIHPSLTQEIVNKDEKRTLHLPWTWFSSECIC